MTYTIYMRAGPDPDSLMWSQYFKHNANLRYLLFPEHVSKPDNENFCC